jgi:hypothetical protein
MQSHPLPTPVVIVTLLFTAIAGEKQMSGYATTQEFAGDILTTGVRISLRRRI